METELILSNKKYSIYKALLVIDLLCIDVKSILRRVDYTNYDNFLKPRHY